MTTTSRRRFLKQSACAAALAAAPVSQPLLGANRDGGKKMRFGLVTYMWGSDWDLPTLIGNCEQTDVLGVELRTTHAHGVERNLNARQRKDVKRRFADSPVTLVGLGSNERFDSPDPAALKKAVEAVKAFIKLSHDVGGSGVKIKPNNFHKGVPKENTIRQIGETLNQLGPFAADYGQQIRVEVHGQCAQLPYMKQIMDVATHKTAVICWNSNQTDLAGQGLKHNFGLVRGRFGPTCHVHDLMNKKYPYGQLFSLLVKSRYDGWLLLEASSPRKDRVAALANQRKVFDQLVAQAQA